MAHHPLANLGAEPGRVALPRDTTLDWFRRLLKRNNNCHTTTLPGFLSWLTHPGDDMERRLLLRDLWNEASDAHIARAVIEGSRLMEAKI